MSTQKYVCIDLDGTIAHYKEWQGETFFGDPVEGVQDALERLSAEGWKIIIFTTRSNKALIKSYLKKNSIPFDYINHNPDQPTNAIGGKPFADAYVDDRGIQFNGDWKSTLNETLRFAPWEIRTEANQGDEYRKQAISFLDKDFGEAFQQFRAYDSQIWEITKFSFLQLVGSIGVVWTVFALANGKDAPAILTTQWPLIGAIVLIISFLFSLLAVIYILRIRTYFAATARYINDHRNFFLSSRPIGFSNRSEYYTDFEHPKAFDAFSTQLLSVYTICVVNSFILGFGIGLLLHYLKVPDTWAFVVGFVIWLISGFLSILLSILHLKSKKDKSTAADIFGIKKP